MDLDTVLLLDRDDGSDVNSDVEVTHDHEPPVDTQLEPIEEPEPIDPIAASQLREDGHKGYSPLQDKHSERQIHLPEGFYEQPPLFNNAPDCDGGCSQYCVHNSGASDLRFDLPLLVFKLFFSDWIFELLARNTNAYAELKGAGQGRSWKDVTSAEMRIWIGLLIYMSVFNQSRTEEYWYQKSDWPRHPITRYMGLNRFEQIKRYFHVSLFTGARETTVERLEPVESLLKEAFQKVVTPATSVAVDEMIIRFTGRSKETIMMRGKPVPEGFYVLALCDGGYCWAWLITGEKESNEKVLSEVTERAAPTRVVAMKKLLPTLSKKVLHLVLQLPYQTTFYTIYMDNLFSNPPLFHVLRAYGIAACGTARAACKDWPLIFKSAIKRKVSRLDYNKQYTAKVYGDVAAVVWQDKNLVQFLTTSHDPASKKFIRRRRPTNPRTAWLKGVVQRRWGALGEKVMAHPSYSVDYNNYMGAVDLHSQFRSYASTQLKASRTWMPLWFFLLDVAVINAYIVTRQVFGGKHGSKDDICNLQRSFRLRLAWLLLFTGKSNRKESQDHYRGKRFEPGNPFGRRHSYGASYITKNTTLPVIRYAPGFHHLVRSFEKPRLCAHCRHANQRERAQGREHRKVSRTRCSCFICGEDYPLCKACQKEWHRAA
jgi:hypothetical protein